MKKCIIALIILILSINCVIISPSAQNPFLIKAAANDSSANVIEIDKKYLKAGCTLQVNNPENYALRYYVEKKEIECEELLLSENYYESWIKVEAYNGEECVGSDSAFFSKLPVLYINTDDGEEITSKDEYKTAEMLVQNNTETETEMYTGALKIKGRGNTTWSYPKKPYRIKLDKKTELFGMSKNKNYVLLANYIDECYLRSATGFQVAKELGMYAPSSVWTELVLNGEHVGNYQLCEQIRVDKNRVNVFDWESEAEDLASAVTKAEKKKDNILDKNALEDTLKENLKWVTSGTFTFDEKEYTVADYYNAQQDISGGYLFELSREYDEVSKFITTGGLRVMLKSPEYLSTNSVMFNYAKQFWRDFEKAYKSEDGYVNTSYGKIHYTQLADLDSMVNYWLVMEILGNFDAAKKSRYASKDIGKKLEFGPVWDFDWGCASYVVGNVPTGWIISQQDITDNFFREFLDDPLFICRATEKYWQLRPFLKKLVDGNGIIENEIAYLKESGIVDHKIWSRDKVAGSKGQPRGYANDASTFKTYMRNRIRWLDKQFEKDTTLLSSTKTDTSAFPYTKSDDKLQINLINCGKDLVSGYAPADGVIDINSNLELNVKTDDEDTKSFGLYVNGIYSSDVQFENGEADFTINKKQLTEEVNQKNVISIIGKNSNGETTYKNFATVIKIENNIYTTNGGTEINLNETFLRDENDTTDFGIENEFKNLQILGVQKKESDDGNSIRFVVVVKDEVLQDADDYGFIAIGNNSLDKVKTAAQDLTIESAANIFSCKGTSNYINGEYGKYDSDKGYKYVTYAVNNIGDNAVGARFYIQKGSNVYYADYDKDNKTFNYCAANWAVLN